MNEFSYLLSKDEEVVQILHPDKWSMFLGLAIICGLFIVVGLILIFAVGAIGLIYIALSLVIWLIANLIYKNTVYCITNKRIIVKAGKLIVKDWRFIDLESVTTVDIIISLSDRIMRGGTGSLIFYNTSNALGRYKGGHNRNTFLHIIDPVKWSKTINELIEQARTK